MSWPVMAFFKKKGVDTFERGWTLVDHGPDVDPAMYFRAL